METVGKRTHVILVTSPGIGHLIPLLELGLRLVDQHGLQVTLFTVAVEAASVHSKLESLLCDTNDLLHVEVVQPENLDAKVPPEADLVTRIGVAMREAEPIVRSRIEGMENRPIALIIDLFGTNYYTMADELRMRKYVFITTSAWALAYFVYAHVKLSHGQIESLDSIDVIGCAPVRTADLSEDGHPSSPYFSGFAEHGSMTAAADGILVNSWPALEPDTLKAFEDADLLGSVVKGHVYPIGPVVREPRMSQLDGELRQWLDRQPSESVLFISFGSGGALSDEQTRELASGLEASEHRFVWVLRPPASKTTSNFYFNAEGQNLDGPSAYLPDGFLTRIQGRGLVVPNWAPQTEILAHPSIRGFLTHCGWNSILESVVSGVPMIAWPLYSEQKMNATMLSEHLGIGVGSRKRPDEGVIGREEVEKMVRIVMEDGEGGAGFRGRAKELKVSAAEAVDKAGNGSSSYRSLREFVQVLRDGNVVENTRRIS
uniref:Glycosyltransferase n=1 Tax=Kalanchoe fedtschenkoi TaxID=63787 RepID=A0A7N0SVZ6_KALFE